MSPKVQQSSGAYWFLIVGLICLPGFAFLLFLALYQFTIIYIHYLVGIVISCAAIALIASVIDGYTDSLLKRAEKLAFQHDSIRTGWIILSVSLTMTAVLVSVTMFAWISYCLIKLDLVKDFVSDSNPLTFISIIQTYAWHLVDLIPQSNVKETIGMPAPIVKFIGWKSGAPILGFRLLVIIILFANITDSWKKYKSSAQK